jgi:hypothetical protein
MEGKSELNFLSPEPKTAFEGAIEVRKQKDTQQIIKIFFITQTFSML